MAFLDGRLVSHFADGNLLAKLMMSPYEEEKDNEWARNERVNSKITVSLLHCSRIPGNPYVQHSAMMYTFLPRRKPNLFGPEQISTHTVSKVLILAYSSKASSFKVHLDPPQPHEV